MAPAITRFSPPVIFVPERVMAVPRLDRDEPALRASRVGFDSGAGPIVSALHNAPAATATVSAPALERAIAEAVLSHGHSELAGSVDGARARQLPDFSSAGSFLSNGGSDPLGARDALNTQASAQSNAESVVLASMEKALDHQVAMSIINNIGRAA